MIGFLRPRLQNDGKYHKQKGTDDAFIVRHMCGTKPHFRHRNQALILRAEKGSLSNSYVYTLIRLKNADFLLNCKQAMYLLNYLEV